MNRILTSLAFSAIVAAATTISAAQDWQAQDYSLSMAGAMINDHCGKAWQEEGYLSVHACNYRLANLFSPAISSQQFAECAEIARGDIVMIADCMSQRFNSWLAQQAQ